MRSVTLRATIAVQVQLGQSTLPEGTSVSPGVKYTLTKVILSLSHLNEFLERSVSETGKVFHHFHDTQTGGKLKCPYPHKRNSYRDVERDLKRGKRKGQMCPPKKICSVSVTFNNSPHFSTSLPLQTQETLGSCYQIAPCVFYICLLLVISTVVYPSVFCMSSMSRYPQIQNNSRVEVDLMAIRSSSRDLIHLVQAVDLTSNLTSTN